MGRDIIETVCWRDGVRAIAGVDEVGRGCLAGPLVAASVILPRAPWLPSPLRPSEIRDSKKLLPDERGRLYPLILEVCLDWNIVVIDAPTIDRINIFEASLKAMRTAVMGLKLTPDLVLVDGPWPLQCGRTERTIIGGDDKSLNIGAASIVAKVTRDRIMENYTPRYPGFTFAAHKGYGTAAHLDEIRRHGLTPLHRLSFAPCRPA